LLFCTYVSTNIRTKSGVLLFRLDFIFKNSCYRLSFAAVGDCGLFSWPPTPKFEWGRILVLSP